MGAICSKKASYPTEFQEKVQQLEVIREGTLQIIQQLEKMNSIALTNLEKSKKKEKNEQPKRHIMDELGDTCIKYSSHFAGHIYGEQLARLSTACKMYSKKSAETRGKMEHDCIAPMRQWAGDGFDNLMKELTKCQKMKEELKLAEKKSAAKPNDQQIVERLEKAKKDYESQRKYCTKEFETTEKVFATHMQYFRQISDFLFTDSVAACIMLTGAAKDNMTIQTQQTQMK